MSRQGSRLSYADLECMPDDGKRYELHGGEAVMVPAPFPRHQYTVRNIAEVLRAHASRYGGDMLFSPLDIVFSEYDVLQPDIVFFTAARAHLIHLDRAIHDVPDLAVEVLSSGTEATDRGRKMAMFARFGVPEYWIADPTVKYVEVHALLHGSYQLRQRAEGATHSLVLRDLDFTASTAFER